MKTFLKTCFLTSAAIVAAVAFSSSAFAQTSVGEETRAFGMSASSAANAATARAYGGETSIGSDVARREYGSSVSGAAQSGRRREITLSSYSPPIVSYGR